MLDLIGPNSEIYFTSLNPHTGTNLQTSLSKSKPNHKKAHADSTPFTTSINNPNGPYSTYSRVCLLDPKAEKELSPEDGEAFDIFLYGGILGDDPPRDRTGELRKYGFEGRHLGIKQMTTDTAVGVTKMVVEDQSGFDSSVL